MAASNACWFDAAAHGIMTSSACPLCDTLGGVLVFQAEKFRVIRAQEAAFPAFYRLVWSTHVAEFSTLTTPDQALCMQAVAVVEKTLRELLQPTKINLAALGNVVPHLHWHIIARFDWDSHFPAPVWAPAQRSVDALKLRDLEQRCANVEQAMAQRLGVFAAMTPGA
jgi:diadenosine tetraphosphate (Ap4A) HIT family hydrolase